MRISRPCYDKPHRCPGWAGGGMRYAKIYRCEDGHLPDSMYDGRGWRWRFHRCRTCHLLVLPSNVRWVDWRWLRYWAERKWRDWCYEWETR